MTDPDDIELAEFVHRWAEAIVSNDVDRIGRFTTDDWILLDKPGPIPRETFHGVVASGQLTHHKMTHEVITIRRLNDDTALLITKASTAGSFAGHPVGADEWTSDVLVRTPTGWKCTFTQLTPQEPAH